MAQFTIGYDNLSLNEIANLVLLVDSEVEINTTFS